MAEEEEEGLRVDSKHRNNNNWVIGSGRSGVQTVYTDSKYLHCFLLTSCTQLFFNIEIILYYAEVRPFCVEKFWNWNETCHQVFSSEKFRCSVFCAILWWRINQLGVVLRAGSAVWILSSSSLIRNTNLSRLVSNFTLHFIRLNLKQITALTLTPFTLWMEHERLRHK